MEKIKNLLNPGHSKDDEIMYGSGGNNAGQTSGQGSHLGSSSTNTGATTGSSVPTSTTTGQSQYRSGTANPASTGLGGSSVGASDYANRDRTTQGTSSSTAPTSSTTGQSSYPQSTGTTGANTGYGQNTSTDPSTSGQSHLGRDAALGGAGAGAAGLAAHEAGRHHHDQTTGTGATDSLGQDNTARSVGNAVPGNDGPFGSHQHGGHGHNYGGDPCPPGESSGGSGPIFTHGPHTTDTANRLDPHVPGEFPSDSGMDRHSHTGRDAGLAGGAGAAGVGAYEANKHHNQHNTTGSGMTGSQSSSLPMREHQNAPLGSSSQQPEHHYGRDAGLAGGAGAAGLGAYEANKHHNQQNTATGTGMSTQPQSTSGLPTGTGHVPHASSHHPTSTYDDQRAEDPLSHRHQHGRDTATSQPTQPSSDHHYGRDAAAVGGVGALGAGAYEAEKHHRDERSVPSNTATSSTSAPYNTSGPHSSNAANVVDPRIDSDRSTQQPTSGHHYGRDAAAVGGVGALGTGAYEAEKHHRGEPTSNTTTGATGSSTNAGPHQSNLGNMADPRVDSDRSSQQPSSGHHYGRDAAGAGALGAGAYEAEKHHRDQPSSTTTTTTTTGPHQSNVANRADPRVDSDRSSQQPSQHHYGRDAAAVGGAGALGTGAYEAEKHHGADDHTRYYRSDGTKAGTSTTATPPSQGNVFNPSKHTREQTDQQHHYGRDAAAVGGAGALGTGAYEAEKHHHNSGDSPATGQSSSTTGPYSGNTAPQQQHHYGRDAAVAGGAGAAGVGAYELNNHNRAGATDTDPASKTIGPHSSNVANVMDPRVKPDSSKQHERTTAGPHNSDMMNKADPKVDSDLSKQQGQAGSQHHYGRDAAVAGGSVAAAGGAGYELDKHHQEKLEKERQKEAEKAEKQHENEVAKEEKHHQKEIEKEEKNAKKHHDKEAAAAAAAAEKHHQKDEKKYEKEVEKAEKQHEKEVEKAEKKHEKEAEKEEKKSHGLFGFLHRNKDDKNTETAEERAHDKHKHEGEAALAGTGAAGVGAAAYEHEHGRGAHGDSGLNRDPAVAGRINEPTSSAGTAGLRRDYEEEGATQPSALAVGNDRYSQPSSHSGNVTGTQSGIGGAPYESQTAARSTTDAENQHHYGRDAALGAGGAGAAGTAAYETEKHHHNKLHKDPPAKVQRELDEKAGIVHDPHTGLPMNVGKYGSGAGGTDASANIPGYHSHGGSS